MSHTVVLFHYFCWHDVLLCVFLYDVIYFWGFCWCVSDTHFRVWTFERKREGFLFLRRRFCLFLFFVVLLLHEKKKLSQDCISWLLTKKIIKAVFLEFEILYSKSTVWRSIADWISKRLFFCIFLWHIFHGKRKLILLSGKNCCPIHIFIYFWKHIDIQIVNFISDSWRSNGISIFWVM